MAFDSEALNVLGEPLEGCCNDPLTGFYRDGYCHTGAQDLGVHTVCAVVSDAFLAFSRERGNDLTTPRPEFGFPGLQDGDGWCLCAGRWLEAHEAGAAPRIKLRSTHIRTLDLVPLSVLKPYALDLS
ncbi:MAG: DUF2237 domain-containing protein [Halieaceae bacterium]|nr:DUF2237 domain-containing protein [Halieaceae bacterium]